MSEDSTKLLTNADTTQSNQALLWEETGSGQIYGRLAAKAHEAGIPVSIEGKNTEVEIFRFGDEKAFLYKSLEGATAGERGGIIVPSIEAYQFKRFLWWKEAVSPFTDSLRFLNIPVIWAADDAQAGLGDLYRPRDVLAAYHLGTGDPTRDEQTKKMVESAIREVLSPVLLPDYALERARGALRLSPLTLEGEKGKVADTPAYHTAVAAIGEAAKLLPQRYQRLAKREEAV